MKVELIIFLITALLIANTYYDGKFFKMFNTSQKYVKMATFGFAGLSLYLFFKKNPRNIQGFVSHATDIVKYMPISRGTMDVLTPFLDFTNKSSFNNSSDTYYDDFSNNMQSGMHGGMHGGMHRDMSNHNPQVKRLMQSGKGATKRSVSETKKKFVAAQQGWKCGDCKKQLPAWFEVDHVIRLEYGGSNEVDNLVALCRDCHGKKTAYENL